MRLNLVMIFQKKKKRLNLVSSFPHKKMYAQVIDSLHSSMVESKKLVAQYYHLMLVCIAQTFMHCRLMLSILK